jgi:serine/threonine-protein kinase
MAEVFMARDTRLGRTVAVKTLRADLSRDPTFQARFRREAQSAASLNHPAIVAIYDTGEDFENNVSVPYIVMEYADGSTLRDLLHSGRRLLPERALEITAGVLQALDYSHRNGIIHRDIKPANIMLTRAGTVKVMDFGIARAMADNGMTMTQTAAVIGTAQYLSPEQAKGETVDARSDLYSTGCLLYELLTGRPPFVGDSPVAVAYQHVREEPLPPSSYDPEVTPAIDAVVLKSLAKSADQRYQSATEMRADIERVLDGRPTEAQTTVLGAANMPTQRLDPRAAAAGVNMTKAMPAVDAPTGYGTPSRPYDDPYDRGGRPPAGPPSRRTESRRPPEPERNGKAGYVILGVAAVAAVIAAVLLANTLLKSGGNSVTTQVPNIQGQTVAQAQQTIANANAGLTGKDRWTLSGSYCGSGVIDPNTDKDHINGQKPSADDFLTPQAISYCVSLGAQTGKIPQAAQLNSMTEDQLKTFLKSQGFNIDTVTGQTVASNTVKQGDIIDVIDFNANTSVAGKSVPTSTTLSWTISGGPANVAVPDVTGETVQNATKALTQANLVEAEQDTYSDTVPQGSVISTDPPANTQVAPGSKVTLIVSKGQQPTSPPSSGCDPSDPSCQTQPSDGSTSQNNGPGGLLGGPGSSPTTKKNG